MSLGGLSCHANAWDTDKAVVPNTPSMVSAFSKIAHPPALWLHSAHLGECAHGFLVSVYLDQPGPVWAMSSGNPAAWEPSLDGLATQTRPREKLCQTLPGPDKPAQPCTVLPPTPAHSTTAPVPSLQQLLS